MAREEKAVNLRRSETRNLQPRRHKKSPYRHHVRARGAPEVTPPTALPSLALRSKVSCRHGGRQPASPARPEMTWREVNTKSR